MAFLTIEMQCGKHRVGALFSSYTSVLGSSRPRRSPGPCRNRDLDGLRRAAGARRFLLPKYSPNLNPMEELFAKSKHWLRKAAARTLDAVCNAIAHTLDTVTASECSNYLVEAGYAPA